MSCLRKGRDWLIDRRFQFEVSGRRENVVRAWFSDRLFCSQSLASSLSYRPGERLALSCLAVDLYSSVQLYGVVSMNVLAVKLDFRYATGLLDNNERSMTLLVYC